MLEIIPPSPSTTSFVLIQVIGTGCDPALSFQRDGFVIDLLETKNCSCVALGPPYTMRVDLGQIEAGTYTINRAIYRVPVNTQCDRELIGTATYDFAVIQAVVPPPVFVPISGAAALGLALALAVCAAIVLRHRSGAQS